MNKFSMIQRPVEPTADAKPSMSVDAEVCCPPLDSEAPPWVGELMRGAREDAALTRDIGGVAVAVRRHTEWAHLRATVRGALGLSRANFEQTAHDAYREIANAVTAIGHIPVRFWNFVPDLNADIDAHFERYMAFNVGRFNACVEWLGEPSGFGQTLATASAVGVETQDLQVHCLTTASGGQPIENPRQVSSYHYSRRFGPRPPCFARATRVLMHGKPVLFIGGTASIVGERSLHAGDLALQTAETINNLEALVMRALTDDGSSALDRLRELRVYVRESAAAVDVQDMLMERCRKLKRVEFARAQICRKELLVEIEGIADLS